MKKIWLHSMASHNGTEIEQAQELDSKLTLSDFCKLIYVLVINYNELKQLFLR